MLARASAGVILLFTLGAAPSVAGQESITVFAAASLKNALDDADATFSKATGIVVTASYQASSALAKQIENDAPADLFISADLDWMNYLQQRNLIKTETRANLVGNRPPVRNADSANSTASASIPDSRKWAIVASMS